MFDLKYVITPLTPFNYDFQHFVYKNTTDVTNKTIYIVNKGFALLGRVEAFKSNRKAMNRNWSNQKPNPALKTIMGNK